MSPSRLLDRLVAAADRLSRGAVWITGIVLVVISLVIAGDVIARRFFNASLAGSDEIAGYVLAVSCTWAYGYTLLRRGHVRIDSLLMLLPLKVRCALDLVALVALATFVMPLTYFAANVLVQSVGFQSRAMTPLRTPLWIPQGLWVLGLILFLAVIGLLVARTAAALARRDLAAVAALAGIRSVEEAAPDEVDEGAIGPGAAASRPGPDSAPGSSSRAGTRGRP